MTNLKYSNSEEEIRLSSNKSIFYIGYIKKEEFFQNDEKLKDKYYPFNLNALIKQGKINVIEKMIKTNYSQDSDEFY